MPRAQGCTAMVMYGGGDICYCVDVGRLCRAQYGSIEPPMIKRRTMVTNFLTQRVHRFVDKNIL